MGEQWLDKPPAYGPMSFWSMSQFGHNADYVKFAVKKLLAQFSKKNVVFSDENARPGPEHLPSTGWMLVGK